MKISKKGYLSWAAAIFMVCLTAARAQEDLPPDTSADESIVYLRPPQTRLARLDQSLGLTKTQKAKVLKALRKVDASVRAAVESGNEAIRLILSEDQLAQFDEMKPDTETAPASRSQNARHLPRFQGQQGEQGRGSQGGQGRGGGMGGRGGGQGGQGMGGRRGRQGGGMQGGGTQGGGTQGGGQRGYCGDGTCQEVERARGFCTQDCGQSGE